ncbi:hypothetical protein PSE_0952 [Pseudovibrio sp. FO-BEG1]|uniref:hypothetical protein n=1 Tax=Pseudovibrio sp. (strain FO-BEG1) TaxID=911045 RepID=UPI000238C54F|nr:hypothetical protein [Pseudovibrio sp. FO-BEG1]AEV35464.1 hypothetical protein PSE_0952 [Pseudovibrio sp. FO-BEG1]
MAIYFFIDSKGKSSANQYTFAFENDLFSPKDVEVIVKFRLRSFLGNLRAWLKYRFKVKFVLKVREGCAPIRGSSVFYFFNSVENVRLLKNREVKHIFFGHGESNKRASLHPMYRIYDYLLVAGPYASQRLQKYSLLNQATAEQNVLDIGGAGVANVSTCNLRLLSSNSASVSGNGLMYMPTWEGGTEAENSSTLCEPQLLEFLVEAKNAFQADYIYLKPHPNIGSRLKQYKNSFASLVTKLSSKGLKVVFSENDLKLLPFVCRRNSKRLGCPEDTLQFAAAIVDVSAAETMAAKIGVPSIVLATAHSDLYAPDSYLEEKGDSIIHLDKWDSMEKCAEFAAVQASEGYQDEFMMHFQKDGNRKFYQALERVAKSD